MCLSHEDVLSCSWEVGIGYFIFLFESDGSLGSGPASAFVVWKASQSFLHMFVSVPHWCRMSSKSTIPCVTDSSLLIHVLVLYCLMERIWSSGLERTLLGFTCNTENSQCRVHAIQYLNTTNPPQNKDFQ